VADNNPSPNDVTVNGRLIAGQWKMVTAMNDALQNFSVNVYIEPIPNYSPPWGLRIENRGAID